jgi:hypothetical protein
MPEPPGSLRKSRVCHLWHFSQRNQESRSIPNGLRAQTGCRRKSNAAARSEFERAARSGTLRAPPTTTPPKPAEATLGFSSTRKTIDIPPVRRYCSGQKKRWFKIPLQIANYANIVPSHYNVDLAVSYDMGDQPENEYLRNISLQLVVNNVTNKKLKAKF